MNSIFAGSKAALIGFALGSFLFSQRAGAEACSGSYEATRLNPLPKPTTVSWTLLNDSPVNQGLLERFAAGLQEVGLRMQSGGNVTLKMSFGLTPVAGSGAGARLINFNWADPSKWSSGRAPPISGSTLDFNAVVVETGSGQMDWIATGRCTVGTEDNGVLAEELGRLIGRAIGSETQRGRI